MLYLFILIERIFKCSVPSWPPCKSSPGGALCTGSRCNPRHSFQEIIKYYINDDKNNNNEDHKNDNNNNNNNNDNDNDNIMITIIIMLCALVLDVIHVTPSKSKSTSSYYLTCEIKISLVLCQRKISLLAKNQCRNNGKIS